MADLPYPGRTALALALTVTGAADVRAAPPTGAPAPAPVCDATPTLEDARLTVGRDLNTRAERLFGEQDFVGAAKAYEQVLVLIPEREEAVRVPLAHAHHAAYRTDNDVKRLHSARQLFTAQLEGAAPGSDERAEIEAELAEIERELEAEAEAERAARERRDEEIRRAAVVKLEAQNRAEREKRLALVGTVYYGAGGSLVGLGAGSLAAMTAFLVIGARLEREGQATAASQGVDDRTYQDLLARGQTQNRAAVATGVVGGVLTAVGGTLLVMAVRHKRGKKQRVAMYPTAGGLQLRF